MIAWSIATFPIAITTSAVAATPHLAGGGAMEISLARIVSALLLCLVIAAIAVLVLKRGAARPSLASFRVLSRANTDRRIAVMETRRISMHADACLLRCDGVDYLILSSAERQLVLRETPVVAEAP